MKSPFCTHPDNDPGCGTCIAYNRMYQLDHKMNLSKAEGKELEQLYKRFGVG